MPTSGPPSGQPSAAATGSGRPRCMSWRADVPHMKLQLPFMEIGFATDPVSPEFGAEISAAGDGGHSDCLQPGSSPLKNIARIVAGTATSAEPSGERHA
ncbi:hypothetical protein [Streptomyces sp. BE133]|uniref:hypothetical protein n=1 Tax=Streptomyces sp. BE133 TaxID=3002523 RepID=UPI002E797F48|nr:hypothetical protein [Streptomyces sp. BE133]